MNYTRTYRALFVLLLVAGVLPLPYFGVSYASAMSLIQKSLLTASDGVAGDVLGYNVAVSGNYAVLGAGGRDSNTGAAYLYDISDPTNPIQKSIITASDGAPNDNFGYDNVAISGNYVLVGTAYRDSGTGAAYLYDISDPAHPVEKAIITASDGAPGDYFGLSLAISGNVVVVNASRRDSNAGAAYLYDISDPAHPVEKAIITASDSAPDLYFGYSASIEGNLVLIGAALKNSATGAAYLYDISDPTNPVQKSIITASDGSAGDGFGLGKLSPSGTLALISAPSRDSATGAAYLYDISDPTNPIQKSIITPSDGVVGDSFGYDYFGLSDSLAVVGSYKNSNAGAAYVYDISDPANPVEKIILTEPSPAADNYFGETIALQDNLILLDAAGKNSGTGAAYLYQIVDTPTLTTIGASSITTTGAILEGSLDTTGGENPTVRGFVYGTSSSYGATTTESGSFTAGAFSAALSSLTCGTTYYYAAYATNSDSTGYGSQSSFSTSACSVHRSHSSYSPYVPPVQTITPVVTTVTTPVAPLFTRYLTLGLKHSEVRLLQILLNAKGFTLATSGPGSAGNETDLFGALTKAAVIRYQIAHGISPTGTVGPITRAALNAGL